MNGRSTLFRKSSFALGVSRDGDEECGRLMVRRTGAFYGGNPGGVFLALLLLPEYNPLVEKG